MKSEKIKVGCIGAGPRGFEVYGYLIENPNVIAYAICDKNPEMLEKRRQELEEKNISGVQYFTSIDEFLKSDVEAVLVGTHVTSHAEISLRCLKAGKHVLSEIPNISSFEEAEKLNEVLKGHPELKYMVGENACFHAFVQTWKDMYEKGMLGDAVYGEADYIHPHMELQQYDEEGNPILTWRSYMPSVHYLTHDLGLLLYILDDDCEDVSAFIPKINPIKDVHPAPADGLIVAHTKKGALLKCFVGFGVHHTCRHNISLFGSDGSLEYRRRREEQGALGWFKGIPHGPSEVILPINEFSARTDRGHGGADVKMVNAFVDCIIKDKKPLLGLRYGINISLPGLLAEQSINEGGKTFKMPDLSEFN